ncbi:WXG100 family type VII secretion target [Glaciibacter psychrotolerans]|uniref:WXG100 family type VII secretion target n=1 Tax=Glaciibacter psychrotolerans TaxID=670054 RepID=A0A7Z0EFZ3_9MICO|nr:WXG100 family type VII secretion target [Leifsonia psychrotolerans]NYJ20966.1 WXG100 family type VII secretion target [Leifsonia psychrotolerans]
MSQFRVSTPSLGYSAASITAALAEFDAHVSQVTAAVNGVVGNSWEGEASEAFSGGWTSWLQSAGMTRAALADIATRLHTAESSYEIVESQLNAQSRTSSIAGGDIRTGSGRSAS